jgi:hypothetical protein
MLELLHSGPAHLVRKNQASTIRDLKDAKYEASIMQRPGEEHLLAAASQAPPSQGQARISVFLLSFTFPHQHCYGDWTLKG